MLTEEETLKVCCGCLKDMDFSTGPETKAQDLAAKYIVWYILKDNVEMTEEEINQKFQEIIVSSILEDLVDKGLVDVNFEDGDVLYIANEKGLETLKKEIEKNEQ